MGTVGAVVDVSVGVAGMGAGVVGAEGVKTQAMVVNITINPPNLFCLITHLCKNPIPEADTQLHGSLPTFGAREERRTGGHS